MSAKVAQQLLGLNTCASNKSVHLAAAADLIPKPCATQAEAQAKHDRLAQISKDQEEKCAQAHAHAAKVEDALHREDIEREEAADHPSCSLATPVRPSVKEQQKIQEKQSGTGGNTQAAHTANGSSKKKRNDDQKLQGAFNKKGLDSKKTTNTLAFRAVVERKQDDDNSLVKTSGFLDDDEDNEVEKAAMRKMGNIP
ncbi:hypothetical protein C0992_000555 [Termitomyces sp. T32_za158]|nr:hypothetical protein C0992_000555 [Termitomyces sp. T32_za158]